MGLTPSNTPLGELDLRQPDALIEFVEGVNSAVSRARLAKHSPLEWLTLPAPHCLLLIDLADDPSDPHVPGSNYALFMQHVGPKKLAYALANDAPGFAADLLGHLAVCLNILHPDTPPRDVTQD